MTLLHNAHKLRSIIAPMIVMAAALLAPDAHAQWKWRDASGRVQFSDLPPPVTVPDKDILQRPGPKPAVVAPAGPAASAVVPPARGTAADRQDRSGPTGNAEGEQAQRRKAEEQERKNRQRTEDERLANQRQDNCQRAREAVATLESGQRIARINAKGEREVLSDDQRAEETRRAKAVVTADCR